MNELRILYEELNRFFDHIYVITIPRATERHQGIREVLDGLNYQFFWGADSKDFSIEQLKREGTYDINTAIKKHRYGKEMKPGMLGCTLSHKMVYEDIIQNNYNKVLIFEDDVIPNIEGLRLFTQIIKELPPDWGLVYFDYQKNTELTFSRWIKQKIYHVQKALGFLNYTHSTIHNLYARPYSAHLKRAGHHDFASAYCITKDTASKLVKLQTPVTFWPDHLLAYACSNRIVKGFITIPKLFIQESQFKKETVGSYTEV